MSPPNCRSACPGSAAVHAEPPLPTFGARLPAFSGGVRWGDRVRISDMRGDERGVSRGHR